MTTKFVNLGVAYSRISMDVEDEVQATQFTLPQINFLKNLLSSYCEDKLNLVVDVNNLYDTVQKEAYMRGQIEIIKYLIECSEQN